MADSSADRDPFDRLAEEFVARYRAGERPSVTEYAARHPDLADQVRDLLPALVEMEQLKPVTADHDNGSTRPAGPADPDRVGEFRILRRVGTGGMGVVYEAVQESLGRHVALKLLPIDALADPKRLERFRREAKAAARLHHTNIVPVFGTGEADGRHFYAMQFIAGHPLDAVIDEVRRLKDKSAAPIGRAVSEVAAALVSGTFARPTPAADPTVTHHPGSVPSETSSGSTPAMSGSLSDGGRHYWATVARVGAQVADALAYAHAQGVLHRDIKPSNLLLDLRGTVWVTDFGLAKASETDDLTQEGDFIGTIRYMAPERFDGAGDARSDTYALGLTLYELLTLKPAFQAETRAKLVEQVIAASPKSPRSINPAIPRDLETIVLKAIQRDPVMRYQSASDMADDLRRYTEDRPIRARRASGAERAWRWCRRNPAVASLMAAVATLLVGATVASLIAAAHFDRLAKEERLAKGREAEQRQVADDARRDRERTLADSYASLGLAAGARGDSRQAVLWFTNAARLAGDDSDRAEANRIRAAAWSRLAIQPVRQFVHPTEWIANNLAFHPGGQHLLTHGFDPATKTTDCRLWDLERGEALPFPGNPGVVSTAAWDSAGERLAIGTVRDGVAIHRFPSAELVHRISCEGRVKAVLFSPDGRYCAVAAGKRARVWDCKQAKFVMPELWHDAPITTLAFHPRGELLATACADHSCRVFAVPTEADQPLFPPVRHFQVPSGVGQTPVPLLFLDDGSGLLLHWGTRNLDVSPMTWHDAHTGAVVRKSPFGTPAGGTLAVGSTVDSLALSRDGKYLAIGGGSSVGYARIYDSATGQPVGPYLEHRQLQTVMSVSFSPDGKTLLTGCSDHTARLWSVPDGKPLGVPLIHATTVTGVAFAPDGRRFATAARGGLIRLWQLPAANPRDFVAKNNDSVFFRISCDGRFVLPTGTASREASSQTTQVVELTTGRRAGAALDAEGLILNAAISPDGLQAATAASLATQSDRLTAPGRGAMPPGQVRLWNWQTGKLQHKPIQLQSEPRHVDYSPDGRQLAVICANGELVAVNPATAQVLRRWQAHPASPANNWYSHNGAVCFGPDGRDLFTFGTPTNSARAWDAATGQLRYELKHRAKCESVQFSPDGGLVSTASFDNQVCVWDRATGERVATLIHPDWTYNALFSPDGRQLLSACRDGMARLWDWRAGRLVCPPVEHDHEVHAVGFSRDGRHVLSGSDDGVLKIWEWRTGKPVCPPLALGDAISDLAVTLDSSQVVCGGFFRKTAVFDLRDRLAPSPLGPDDLCAWAEIVSGQRIEDGGGLANLTDEEWLGRWNDFRRRHGDLRPGGSR